MRKPRFVAVIPSLVVAAAVARVRAEVPPPNDANAPRELHAMMALRAICAGQQQFFRSTGRYGSLDELTRRTPGRGGSALLPPSFAPVTRDSALRKDYYIRVHVETGADSPLGDWYAYAWPKSDGLFYRTFVMWSDGTMFAVNGYAGSLYPPASAAFPADGSNSDARSYAGTDGHQWWLTG